MPKEETTPQYIVLSAPEAATAKDASATAATPARRATSHIDVRAPRRRRSGCRATSATRTGVDATRAEAAAQIVAFAREQAGHVHDATVVP